MHEEAPASELQKVPSGTPGLDTVLNGGLVRGTTTIVLGGPGSGKTILALQFLAASERRGLYIGFEEREADLRRNAAQLGIALDHVDFLDLSASADQFFTKDAYTLIHSDEYEGEALLEQISDRIESADIDRLVVDPLSELRSLLPDNYQFRRKVSALLNSLAEREVTTVCTVQRSDPQTELSLQYLGDTTIDLARSDYKRTLEVVKNRGSPSKEGGHTFRIRTGSGGRVYPKLVPGDHTAEWSREQLASGVEGLDDMLNGGLERGSVTIISGPAGVGKTTTATNLLQGALDGGETALSILFEELAPDYLYRAKALGFRLEDYETDGQLEVSSIEALTKTPDELAAHVVEAVEEHGVTFVTLDGLSGYRLSFPDSQSADTITREVHALCRYLKRMGVTVVLVEEVEKVTGEFESTTRHVSYLADTMVFLRYFEDDGVIRKAIGVLKKRFGDFEPAIRHFAIGEGGVIVGDRIRGYRGLLTGIPQPDHDDRR